MHLDKLAYNHNVSCAVTFYQPLFWKASQIINGQTDLQDIIFMLGTFHSLMNVFGATLINGLGFFQVLEKIYE